jgi:hypothetical protein
MARQGDNNYLVISDSASEDSANYTANASNKVGNSKSNGRLSVDGGSNSAFRTVNSTEKVTSSSSSSTSVSKRGTSGQPPEFKKLFYDRQVNIGDNVRLDTVITGSPKPKVSLIY